MGGAGERVREGRMRDGAGGAGRYGRAYGRARAAVVGLLLALTLAACSLGGTATPAPATAAASATPGLPGTPYATLPPTPPTALVTRPGTPAMPPAATVPRGGTPGGTPAEGRRRTVTASPIVPTGELPAGWRVYTGPLPFTIAYPPDWTVEEDAARGLVYFYAPDPARTTFLVIATGAPVTDPNLDVLRDRWFQARTAPCQRFAVVATGQERHSGLDFATAGTTCDLPGGLAYSLTGIAVRDRTPWIYEFDAPYGTYPLTLAAAFTPMIHTLRIYGTVAP